MKKPVISIIIPVYNAEKYIRECMDSCVVTNVSSDLYEIICIDDGSNDNTLCILREYEKKYCNIKIIEQEINKGVSAARNKGIGVARGEYIWFVDADDYIESVRLTELLKILEHGTYEQVYFKMCFFKTVFENDNDHVFRRMIQPPCYYKGSVSSRIFRCDIIISNNIYFNTGVRYGEDELFIFTYELSCKRIKQLDFAAYYYRENPQSAMHNIIIERYLDSMINSCIELKRMISYYESINNSDLVIDIYSFMVTRVNCALDRIVTQPLPKQKAYLQLLKKYELISIRIPSEYKDSVKGYYKCTMEYYRRLKREYYYKYKIMPRVKHPFVSIKHLISR